MNTQRDEWLFTGPPLDEGDRTAVYPYSKLTPIFCTDDCRVAVLDETLALEYEFGVDRVLPFYRLLWVINTIHDVFTSHTTVSPVDWKGPFDWAASAIGTAIVVLPREQWKRFELAAAEGMSTELLVTLRDSPLSRCDKTGWKISVSPANVILAEAAPGREDRTGYGHEIIISGSAGDRAGASERWSRAVTFIADTLIEIQKRSGVAEPYDHEGFVGSEVTFR